MKKYSKITILLLIVASIGAMAAFSNTLSVKGFLLSVYSTALDNKSQTQPISAQESTGTLTIKVTYGTMYAGNVSNYFTSERELTASEISQTSLRIFQQTTYTQTVAKIGVKPGDVLTLPAGNYAVSADSVPSGEAFTTFGALFSPTNCFVPVVSAGKNTTCTAGLYNGTIVNVKTNPFPGVQAGPSATIPQPTPSAVSAQFQKVLLDVSPASFMRDSRIYKYQGKTYLLAAAGTGGKYKIYVFDVSQSLSPKLLTTAGFEIIGSSYPFANWITLDDYQYIIAFGKVFSFASSGSLTFVKDVCATGQTASCADAASPMALFKAGTKVYLAAYASDYKTLYPNDVNTAEGQYKTSPTTGGTTITLPVYTNAILFYDVTSGLGKTLSKSGITSGFRTTPTLISHNINGFPTSDVSEVLREPVSYTEFGDPPSFGVTIGGKTYFVTEWKRVVHSRHGDTGHYSVVDVSDINNPQEVLKAISGQGPVIFGHDQGLTSLEKTWLNYESGYKTLVDLENKSAVHWFPIGVAGLGLFAPVFDTDIVAQNMSLVRLRQIIMGAELVGGQFIFSETSNTRTVLCEQIGGDDPDATGCGSRPNKTNTANFGYPVGYKNGVVIGSTGKTGVFSSSGFAFADTSSQITGPLASTPTPVGSPLAAFKLLYGASLVQMDSKNFVVYVMTDKNMGMTKLTVSTALTSGAGQGGPFIQTQNALPTQTPFSFSSLLRIFKRVLQVQ